MKHITESAPMTTEKRPDCPEALAACVMRCLEKEPESRWPTADALRRALESRSAAPYRPRRSMPSRPGTALRRMPEDLPPLPPAARNRELSRRSQRRDLAPRGQGGEPDVVRRTRHAFVTWESVFSGGDVLGLVNIRSLYCVGVGCAIWGAFGVLPRFWKLWEAGYS